MARLLAVKKSNMHLGIPSLFHTFPIKMKCILEMELSTQKNRPNLCSTEMDKSVSLSAYVFFKASLGYKNDRPKSLARYLLILK